MPNLFSLGVSLNCSEQNLTDLASWKPNLPSQHGAFKENINFCEVSHKIMRVGNGKEQMTTCQRL